jgi:hypothetical protein
MTTLGTAAGFSRHALADWVVKRGVLFAFLQMPIAALFAGFLLRVTTLPLATFGVFVSFAAFTAWVSHRRAVSDDPTEPVHHLHRYALYALLPYAVFSVARIPAFYTSHLVYWQLWYGFGSQLTGESGTRLASLVPGMVMYTIQGIGLVVSFYVLFQRHSLINAVLFLGVLLPALFCYIFPVFALPGAAPGTTWYLVHWLAHLAMAVTAWAMPTFWARLPHLGRGRAAAGLATVVALIATPYAFAAERATGWQFDRQAAIDRAAFAALSVTGPADPILATIDGHENTYRYTLHIGPRTYTNAAGASRAVDAGPVHVTGRLLHDGTVIAWCTGYLTALPTPNSTRDPAAFTTALHRLDHVDLPVTCNGPVQAPRVGSVDVSWTLDTTLKGDREQQHTKRDGHTQARLQQQ